MKNNDIHAEKYRKNIELSRAISGDAHTFFAEYQALKLAEWLSNKKDSSISILDFGCGHGLMTSIVQHLFVNATLYGIDPSDESIDLAQEIYEGIHFSTLGDTLHFPDNTFDLIYTSEVFHHIPPEEHAAYCTALLRILKPGGTLIIFELNPLNPATVFRFKTNPYEDDAELLSPWYLQHLLEPHGVVTTRFYDFFPNFMGYLRFLEPYITWLPCGALYATSVTK